MPYIIIVSSSYSSVRRSYNFCAKVKSELYYDRRTDGQSASLYWCQAPIWGPRPIFNFFLYSYGSVDVGRPLWREVGSVVFSFSWASPAQSFSGLSPERLMPIFYCLNCWDSPKMKGQVPVFISPRNRVAQLHPQALSLPNSFTYYYIMYIKSCIHTLYT
jgi:hypothetical protein